jgi:hypothetical protein
MRDLLFGWFHQSWDGTQIMALIYRKMPMAPAVDAIKANLTILLARRPAPVFQSRFRPISLATGN